MIAGYKGKKEIYSSCGFFSHDFFLLNFIISDLNSQVLMMLLLDILFTLFTNISFARSLDERRQLRPLSLNIAGLCAFGARRAVAKQRCAWNFAAASIKCQ